MLKNIVIFCILSPLTLCQYTYRYIPDGATEFDKKKVKTLCNELIAESKYKIKQTDPIRDQFASEIGFQLGTLIGYIREKYKTMLELYRLAYNKYTKKSNIILSRIPLVRPIHYFLRFEMISSLEVDIERLVHILETIPNRTLGIYNSRRSGSYDVDSSEMANYKEKIFKLLQLYP